MKDVLLDRFRMSRRAGRPAFVAYIAAGDPDFEKSIEIADVLAKSGVDVLELGVPFSDPLADGEANQLAAARALNAGMTPLGTLELASRVKSRHPDLPLVLFTYLNPVASLLDVPFHDFCVKAYESGVDAILPLDLPPEELDGACSGCLDAPTYRAAIKDSGLKLVSLVAPNTPDERIERLVSETDAFVYLISREGVTGEGTTFSAGFADRLAVVQKATDLPVVVGFGISTPEHVRTAASTGVDGVVVGSAIVRKIEALSKGRDSLDGLGAWVAEMTAAAHAVSR